jgi:K+-sensing histidine kinase KdpD
MSFDTKANCLSSHLLMIQSLEGEHARSVGSVNTGGSLHDEPSLRRVWSSDVLPLLMSLACVGLVTAILLLLARDVAINLVPLAYLLPVIIAATQWGIRPATLASIAGVAAADFFFFPPLYSFQIDDPQDVVDLLLFMVVALVSSNLAARLRRETETLRRRETEIKRLYDFSRRLAGCFTVSDLISAIQNYLSQTLGPHAAFFVTMAGGRFEPSQSAAVPELVQERVASMITSAGAGAQTIVDEPTQNVWLLGAVRSDSTVHGVVVVNIGRDPVATIAVKTRRIETLLEEVSLTLQRLDIGRAMEDARLHLQAQMLRDAFHGTLSHELCTPLAAIKGSASVLNSMPAVRADNQIRSLVEAISDEVAELDGFIQNLLNATRVSADGVKPHLEWVDPRDIVNAAVKRRARRLTAHKVEIEFDEDLPLVKVDSGLIEEACGQLLENAAKYSSSGSTISIRARTEQGRVILTVGDQGVGITADEQQQLGRRSFRSERHRTTIPGSGLGFWIASVFVRANGGAIDISSRGRGLGTTASISLPSSQTKVSELEAFSQ